MNGSPVLEMLGKDTLLSLGASHGYARKLALSHFLREDLLARAIDTLGIANGSRGLDLGCGIGLPALMLANVVGPGGQVTGLDSSEDFLATARNLAGQAGLEERLQFLPGDMAHLPFPDNHFDWLLSIDCAGYAPSPDPAGLLRELGRVVKPGGAVAIMAWTAQQLLPGHPLLEARLNATPAGLAPFTQGGRPEHHFSRALGWYQQAGFREPTARTLIQDIRGPLSPEQRLALISLLDMRWSGAQDRLYPAERDEYTALASPDSADCILDLPAYHAWFVYTLFQGLAP